MMGNSSIDISLKNIWNSWWRFRQGKQATKEIIACEYYLEHELMRLHVDLQRGVYRHGPYRRFVVADSKRREISVANIRDRVIHRLLYDYLVDVFDQTFVFDAWSCRKNKGVVGAIKRAEKFIQAHPRTFVWRTDITKFFDSVQHDVLFTLLARRIDDQIALHLLQKVIGSYLSAGSLRERERERERE